MNLLTKISFTFLMIISLFACSDHENKSAIKVEKLDYDSIVAMVVHDSTVDLSDSANIFDKNAYDPTDSIGVYFDSIENKLMNDSAMVKKIGINDSGILSHAPDPVSVTNANDSFSNSIKKINSEEIKALKYNLDQLHKTDSNKNKVVTCQQINCRVWARVNKTEQRLYLYLDGRLVDTFKVSSGDKKHETPLMNRRPSGPSFQKYTSKKYPGGNYNGLGNMPYVVFLQGGYAIHGTTRGNIPKLGKKASHGCIRLHPDNAKIFFEIVRKAGLDNTWVTIEN